jgi:cytochrome c-type biogenesis protein CcmH
MRRFLVLLSLAALLLAPAAPALDRGGTRPIDRRVQAISRELRCPVCQNLSVWDSPSDVARTFRVRIRELAEQGRSDAQIRSFFVARYGDWILLEPPKRGIGLAVWLAPLAVLGAGGAIVFAAVARWRRRAAAAERLDPSVLAAARARLEALERELPPT